jgi:multimeric flavodoxin WrbA
MLIKIYEDLGSIPPYNTDVEAEAYPEVVKELKRRIRDADGILIVTPEYNYGLPGVLKNAIDWASRPYGDSAWEGKPLAIMGASPGQGGTVGPNSSYGRQRSSSTCCRSTGPRFSSAGRTPGLTPASISLMKRAESLFEMNWKLSPIGLNGSTWGWEQWPHPGSQVRRGQFG